MQGRLEKKIANQNPTYLENPFCPFSVEPVQYTNLDDITDILSDQTLKEKAREYFENSEKVDSILENLTVEGYYVIKDKLCVEIGSAIIDEYGSRLYLYIDVQNGEVVGEEALYVRSCMWIDRNAINRPLKSKSSLKLGNNFWD